MVFRNIHLTGLIAVLAAVTALPLGCGSEFEGCEASRTCPPPNRGGEGGENADTGGTSGTGGNANGGSAPGGSSGAAGMAGDGGTGGIGDDTERPTVVLVTPDDGDVDIERDVTITAELSEAIDESTVTSASVVLSGPDGEVSGTVGVDGSVITFAPERGLNLLGTYTFTLRDTVADLAGNTLEEAASVEFRVRDGRLSEPVFPFGTVPREVRAFGRNELGDVVVGMNAPTLNSSVYGATFSALDGTWTRAAEVHSMDGARLYAQSAGIDSLGRAVVTWYPFSGAGGWSRVAEDGNWTDAGALSSSAVVVVSPEGTAIAEWRDSSNIFTQALNLSDGTLGSALSSSFSEDEYGKIAWSLERTALFVYGNDDAVSDLTVQWKLASGWSAREPLATGSFSSVVVEADEQGNIIVVWASEGEIWSRIYQRAEDEWLPAAFLASGAGAYRVDMMAGSAIVSYVTAAPDAGTWAATYRAGVGWVASSIVQLDPTVLTGVAIALDKAGNGLVAWHSQGKIRRYVSGSGWQPELLLGASTYVDLWAASAADGSVLVVSSEADGQTVGAPYAVRFE